MSGSEMNMPVLRGRRNGKQDKASLLKGGEIVQRKSIFGRYTDAEMVSQLRELALDPCKSGVTRDSIRPLWNQTIRVRKIMTLSSIECPQRKRKLQLFLKDKLGGASGLVSAFSNQQNVTKLSRGQSSHVSSGSCLLNSSNTAEIFDQKTIVNAHSFGSLLSIEGNFQGKQVSSGLSFIDSESVLVQPIKDISSLVDSDESVNGSNPSTRKNLSLHESPTLDECDSVHSSNSSKLEEKKGMHFQSPRRSIRLLNFIGDHLQRMTIPIGPRFQADVPDWTGPTDEGHLNVRDTDGKSSKWLGTRLWPIEDRNLEGTERVVGKGRPESCSCVVSGSTDCIKLHVHEERLSLQSDLGPAFLSWKFDEMGEVVSLAWTVKEQQTFEVLMKTNSKNSLKRALKSFPRKCKKSILTYYLNVFMPRRMSMQTKASPKQIDSDDDKSEDVDNADLEGTCKRSRSTLGSSKDVRARYLLRHHR